MSELAAGGSPVAGGAFALAWLLVLLCAAVVTRAQPTADGTPFLRLADLVRTVDRVGRTNCDFQFEGIVCDVTDRQGTFVFRDSSGIENLRIDMPKPVLKPGMQLRLAGRQCTVSRDGNGLVMSSLLIDDDGIHEMSEKSATTMLSAGRYPIRVVWFNQLGNNGLELSYRGPGMARQKVPASVLSRTVSQGLLASQMPGLDYQVYEGSWFRVPRFDRLDPVKSGVVASFDHSVRTRVENVGIVFSGELQIVTGGEYTFYLSSDDGSQLFLGRPPVTLEIIGNDAVPSPKQFLPGALLKNGAEWGQMEGTVTYAARKGPGFELELRSGTSRWRAEVGEVFLLSARLLLNGRVRLTGICRPTIAPDGARVVANMDLLSRENIELLEPNPVLWSQTATLSAKELAETNSAVPLPMLVHLKGKTTGVVDGGSFTLDDASTQVRVRTLQRLPKDIGQQEVEILGFRGRRGSGFVDSAFVRKLERYSTNELPVLTAIEQVQSLSREQANLGYRVKLRGVITSVVLPFFSDFVLQDATRGIYMISDLNRPDPPQVGDSWEIEGVTGPGDFSPIVLVKKMERLGTGQMPEPVHPTWNQLMNGSLDAQYVELQGVITEVQPEHILLRTPEGRLKIEIGNDKERLPRYENTSVRLRGCMFFHRENARGPGQIWFRDAAIQVEKAPPLDLFDLPLKHARELATFDAQSDPLQRARVPVQVVHERQGIYYAMDEGMGVRFVPKRPSGAVGDLLEVAGFPELNGSLWVLRDAAARKTGQAKLPEPKALTPHGVADGGYDSTLVRVEATVLDVVHGRGEEILELRSNMGSFVARLEHKNGKLPKIGNGSVVELVGVYAVQNTSRNDHGESEYFELLLNSPDDVRILSSPPWWNLRHILTLAVLLLGISLVSTVWIRTLRGQVQIRTRELQDEVEVRKRAEAQAKLATETAHAANRSKSFFLANMSHEIRTPMNGILGMNNLLLDTQLSQDQRDLATIVKSSGESLLSIINDILDFSKVEAGKVNFEMIDFDLREVVENTLCLLAEKAHGKGVELVAKLPADDPLMFVGDSGRIRQVLQNLIGNAVKFTAKGDVVVEVSVEKGLESAIRVAVHDTGVGISEAALARLFNAFEQENAATTRKYGGTGLGLAISKKLVEQMGGEIGVTSRQGSGSVFWFRISLPRVGETSGGGRFQDERLQGQRALVACANQAGRESLEASLQVWGLTCDSTSTQGAELVAQLRKASESTAPYQILVVDAKGGEMDGVSLVRMLRGNPATAQIKVVLLSPMAGSGNVKQQIPAERGSVVVAKPVRQALLRSALVELASSSVPAPGNAPVVAEPAGTDAGPRDQIKILVAEDNLVNQKLISRLLGKLGYTFDLAADGLQALSLFEKSPYEVILMDCQMPEMDGYEVTRRIRSDRRIQVQPWIIAMTANAMQGDREKCLDAGMDDYLTKPIDITVLKAKLAAKAPKSA